MTPAAVALHRQAGAVLTDDGQSVAANQRLSHTTKPAPVPSDAELTPQERGLK
jgi:hypothetical protein